MCEVAVTLYLLTDDVEEFIVVAADRNDLFRVIEEGAGASTADELAASVGEVPKFCAPGLPKVMVCGAAGITELEAADAAPVPALLVAVTVNV